LKTGDDDVEALDLINASKFMRFVYCPYEVASKDVAGLDEACIVPM